MPETDKPANTDSLSESSSASVRAEGEHWSVSVERNGENLVTIESACLSGKPEFTDEEAECIREAGRHLLSFIGGAELAALKQPREEPT